MYISEVVLDRQNWSWAHIGVGYCDMEPVGIDWIADWDTGMICGIRGEAGFEFPMYELLIRTFFPDNNL